MTPKTLLIALSGPSSSGKTTLARHLRDIFNSSPTNLFIIHEDDFYKTDKDIPKGLFSSEDHGTRELDDWDCVESLDLPLLERVLTYVKRYGSLPSDFASKEDQNSVGESGISDEQISSLRDQVQSGQEVTICIVDGFLLYPDPKAEAGSELERLHSILKTVVDLKLFLPSTRQETIKRRTKRTGYVTLEGFWEDPPGYVEDVVWPNYVRDHGWLFGDTKNADAGKVISSAVAEANIRVGPDSSQVGMLEILNWAVEKLNAVVQAS